MKIAVTGAAGFIGSHLCERFVKDDGHDVIAIDAGIGPTPSHLKQRNIETLITYPNFHFIQDSLLHIDLSAVLCDVDVVYHLAAIPGVRSSWGKEFDPYVMNNILATQRLLEACKDIPLKKFILASTSSVYGEKTGKVSEQMTTVPLSPYGVTKLTCEQLCAIYEKSFGIPIVTLRYFTVYGPRQRPDMAFHRFIKQIIEGTPITVFGDGTQTRDFTYIDDCVHGTSAAMYCEGAIGETINIGGKERASVLDVISLLEEMTGAKANLTFLPKLHGEPAHTWADISKARSLLSYSPVTPLKQGLQQEYVYLLDIYRRYST